jgi:hypothetical protein
MFGLQAGMPKVVSLRLGGNRGSKAEVGMVNRFSSVSLGGNEINPNQ